jgi:hypothetical protein
MHRRVQVEIEWLLALAADPRIVELAPFTASQIDTLKAIAAISAWTTARGSRRSRPPPITT